MKKAKITLSALCICTSFLVTNLAESAAPTFPKVPTPAQMATGMRSAGTAAKTGAQNLGTNAWAGAQNTGTKMAVGAQSAAVKAKVGGKNTVSKMKNMGASVSSTFTKKSAAGQGKKAADAEARKKRLEEAKNKDGMTEAGKKRLDKKISAQETKRVTALAKQKTLEEKKAAKDQEISDRKARQEKRSVDSAARRANFAGKGDIAINKRNTDAQTITDQRSGIVRDAQGKIIPNPTISPRSKVEEAALSAKELEQTKKTSLAGSQEPGSPPVYGSPEAPALRRPSEGLTLS